MKPGHIRLLGVVLFLAARPARAETFLEREFSMDPARVRIAHTGQALQVSVPLVSRGRGRWDAASGRPEALGGVRGRRVLEPTEERPLPRGRVVEEWEGPHGLPRTATRLAAGGSRRMAQPFKATQIPSVLGSPVQYVIITNETMQPQFQRLADWKTES